MANQCTPVDVIASVLLTKKRGAMISGPPSATPWAALAILLMVEGTDAVHAGITPTLAHAGAQVGKHLQIG